MRFPEDFVWGVSTSAYQIEGAAGLRGLSIWDTFSHTPGRIRDASTGDMACDHYHRYAEDVALMRGYGAYRFSVSWPRVLPEGHGRVSAAGLDFYDRLVDELVGRGIAPYATLYHWDLPQALEDRGGWPRRDTALRFADYALAVHERLGDRVDTWFTINEPWVAAFLGYADGTHAPGRRSAAEAFRSAHHLLLAHGLATRALRQAGAARIGIALNVSPVLTPGGLADLDAEPSSEDAEAVARIDALLNRQFLDPMLRGSYPAELTKLVAEHGGLDHVLDGDLAVIAQPLDVLGVNYYAPQVVQAQPSRPGEPAFPGSDGVLFAAVPAPATAMGWPIVPGGLTMVLRRLAAEHPGLDLLVTENGAAFDDSPADHDRVAYLDAHVRAAHAAIADGVRLRGFLVWTLLDNFEWADGYQRKFGLFQVDFATQRRTERLSARWFRELIARNGPAPAGRPTLETVAARAGVSRATVSRVVNGEPSVRPVVRARVLAAVEELGYVPNQAARSLATRRSGVVALVLAGPRQDNATLVAAVAQYVTSVLEAAGRQVALMLADTAESHRRILARVEAREVDGVILLPPDRGDTLTERLAGTGVPVVVLGRPGGTAVPYVDVDDAGGGAAVARHLGERGQPGHLWKPEQPTQSGQPGQSGPSGPSGQGGLVVLAGPGVAARERVAGFLGAVPAGGVTPVVVEAGAGVEAGVLAMQRVLADGARPGGVFAVTDQLAIGAIRALRAAGLRVPEDVAVAGFGDGAAGRHLTPGLTTVGVAETEQALALARCLLAALEGHTVVPAVLPVRLIVRESTVSGEWPGGR